MALLLSIPPALPGLVNNINPKVAVGNASFLFDIAWLFGVRTLLFLILKRFLEIEHFSLVFLSILCLSSSFQSVSSPGNFHGNTCHGR